MEEKSVRVPGISCGHCVATIEREIGKMAGIKSVSGDAKSKKVTVRWEAPAGWSEIAERLKELGYPPEV